MVQAKQVANFQANLSRGWGNNFPAFNLGIG